MKRILYFLALILLCAAFLTACGCTEHLDRNGDGRCDKCVKKMPEEATVTTTTAAPVTSAPEFLAHATVAEAVERALAGAYLGGTFDIGLTAETAPYYRIEGEEGFVTLNAEGKLEFIGIRTLTTAFSLIAPDGQTVYSGFYSVGQTPLAIAIRETLYAEGKLAYAGADVNAAALASLSSLSLDGVAVEEYELSAIRYLRGVQTLSLAGQSLGDLSCIRALPELRSLDISRAAGLSIDDGGLAVISNIRSLPSLDTLSICGSFSVINRAVLDTLLSMAANGGLTLSVLGEVALSGVSAIGFGETVFFSFDEYLSHYNRYHGVVTPADGFSHAIFVYSAAEHEKDSPINANALSVLELYGEEGAYYPSPVTSDGDLSVRLYSYSLRAPRTAFGNGIRVGGMLSVTAVSGASSIYGAGWDSSEICYLDPGAGINAGDLHLNIENGAALYVEGGRGLSGANGVTDNWPPDSAITTKRGACGGDGASAILADTVTVYAASGITVRGGQGGRGGDGAKGGTDLAYMTNYGFDGGHGGNGGGGGAAITCDEIRYGIDLTAEEKNNFLINHLIGGQGGRGGSGGAGHLAGKRGSDGATGSQGSAIS